MIYEIIAQSYVIKKRRRVFTAPLLPKTRLN